MLNYELRTPEIKHVTVRSPVCQVVVGVGHIDEALDEVGALDQAEEHLSADRDTVSGGSSAVTSHSGGHIPPSAAGCVDLSRAPSSTCGTFLAMPVCAGRRRGRTRRRRRGRLDPGRPGPQRTGR